MLGLGVAPGGPNGPVVGPLPLSLALLLARGDEGAARAAARRDLLGHARPWAVAPGVAGVGPGGADAELGPLLGSGHQLASVRPPEAGLERPGAGEDIRAHRHVCA